LTFPAPIGTVLWMRIVLMGAPGSGKGTQSQRLVQRFGIPQISTGDLLRSAVARGTDYGRRAKAAMDAGMLVVDEIVLGIIRERLGERDAARGFILDGFPRNLAQAQALQTMLTGIGSTLDAVVLLKSTTPRSSSAYRDAAAVRNARGSSTSLRLNPARPRDAINALTIRCWSSVPMTKKPPCAAVWTSTSARPGRWRSTTPGRGCCTRSMPTRPWTR